MGRSKNTWRGSDGRPPFLVGDMVVPNGNYKYQGWGSCEAREVTSVDYDDACDRWTIRLFNPLSPLGYSNYTPRNFKYASFQYTRKQETKMGYERTKFFAMKILPTEAEEGLLMGSEGYSTNLRDTRHQVQVDVGHIIKHGDKWLVCQTVMMIEGEEPRPPMRITEYK